MLSRRVLNRTLVYQINREEAPPGNNQKGLLEGKPTVQLNRTLGSPFDGKEGRVPIRCAIWRSLRPLRESL